MTAVAPPPNFQNISRTGWSAPNGSSNGLNSMSADDFRMFMPRKPATRSNSSSSLASSASSSSTVSAASQQTNGVAPSPAGEGSGWAGARKKPPRGLWPASKTEPISGISTARPQSIASAGSGPSAASAISALHSPAAPMVPSQHNGATQTQQNGASRPQGPEGQAILHLIPMNGTFERKTINVPFFPDVLRIGRQTNNKTIPTPTNGYFDSKVLSRQHAEVWADRNGKIWIRDVKSSNGTFVNAHRLSQENRDSDPHELREQDMLELGIDIVSEDQKTIVHHKVAARVEHAGIYNSNGNNLLDLNFGSLEDSQLSNLMNANGANSMGNIRGRTPSQGSINGGRLQAPGNVMTNNLNAMAQHRQPNFWLQPITMEQIVKKLNTEMKSARQQSQELQQTSQYINTILTTDTKKESTKPSQVKVSPIKDLKARFSDPPAPPPQQPLPEKPDARQPTLQRSETERPKSNSSPVRTDSFSQGSLANELTSAKKEIESQGLLLKDLQDQLFQERKARENAEERANRLEQEALQSRDIAQPVQVNGVSLGSQSDSDVSERDTDSSSSGAEAATARLQQRLELMVAEMNEMKQQMEKYRERAEAAEAESATHRQSLADMVERIRQDDADRASREARCLSRRTSDLKQPAVSAELDGAIHDDDAEEGEITIINESKEMNGHGAGAYLRRVNLQNGRASSHEDSPDLKNLQALATRSSRNDAALLYGAPAASFFGMIVIGVGILAWLNNGFPKTER